MIRKPYKKRRKKRGPVQSKKISYNGIKFASGLERYMYMALKKSKIKAKYEGETFVLLAGFIFENGGKPPRPMSGFVCASLMNFLNLIDYEFEVGAKR